MSPVPVEILANRPLVVRPTASATLVATRALVIETDADALMEGSAYSGAADGDDNPN
ncbi:hypothetical protein [Streptomyces sp. NPDC057280]|uniref:hypothetical protein n=1 Tax=Streptomyces sp. NPDC057280 TaxID=3346081 RepID=UPI003629A4D3